MLYGTWAYSYSLVNLNSIFILFSRFKAQAWSMSSLDETSTEESSGITKAHLQRSNIDVPFSTFYPHHLDSSCMILISKLLNGDNYISWSWSMKMHSQWKTKYVSLMWIASIHGITIKILWFHGSFTLSWRKCFQVFCLASWKWRFGRSLKKKFTKAMVWGSSNCDVNTSI